VALPRGFEETTGRSPRAAAALAEASAAVAGDSVRDISAAARAASMMLAGPWRSQARLAQADRSAFAALGAGVVSSARVSRRAGDAAPLVDWGEELPA
jgi:hypothetical protein